VNGIIPLRAKGIKIEETVETACRRSRGPGPHHASRENLLSNARQFTQARWTIAISTTRTASPSGIAVSVAIRARDSAR